MIATDLYLEGCSVEEAAGWMQNAISHKGKLSADLDLEKGQRLSDLSADTVIQYALKSPDNKKRVILARSFYYQNPKRKHTSKDKKFWDKVTKGLEKAKKEEKS